METQTRPARDPEDTRRRLLEAAGEILDRDGDLGLRVSEVAAAAGTSVGAIYVHFEDREALIAAVHAVRFRGRSDEQIARIRSVLEADLDRDAMATALLDLIIRPDDEDLTEVRRGRVVALAAAQRDPMLAQVIAQALQELDDQLVALFERAQELGVLRNEVDVHAFSLFAQALPFGLAISDARSVPPPDRETWLRLMRQIGEGLVALGAASTPR